MVQAATSLPVFLLAVPAGALADIVNRRTLLLITQLWMLAASAALSVATYAGAMSPALLLLLTFLLGIGTAMNGPAWQATVTDLVAPEELSAAVALNSAAFNVARAVGPVLGGIILARTGAGTVFLLNALSFIGVLIVLFRWRVTPKESILPAERFLGAMRAGIRYVRYASTGACRFGADFGLHPVRKRPLGIASLGRQKRNETRPVRLRPIAQHSWRRGIDGRGDVAKIEGDCVR
jgi:MFS family permease